MTQPHLSIPKLMSCTLVDQEMTLLKREKQHLGVERWLCWLRFRLVWLRSKGGSEFLTGLAAGYRNLNLKDSIANLLSVAYCMAVSWRNSVNRPPTPDDTAEEEEKQPTLHETINIKLIESGEKERLTELLRERLIECGWKDEMKALCRAFIKKKGRNNVTVDDLVHVITPKGRVSIPDSVKAELLQRIRSFLVQAAV
ncbi:hypothetical protein H0E87_000918 [Populus deltoides]|uniref:Transcription and mRNA export factor ENY2 n=1 Tax=Populus deltoides TaxID=3696 RepID=A0A8T2ZNY7_POPDE|nr:hypothetical protein H0E87_000918 [Populus deltoides]